MMNSVLKKIFNVRRNKKNNLLREIAKASDSLTLLDIGSAGDINLDGYQSQKN